MTFDDTGYSGNQLAMQGLINTGPLVNKSVTSQADILVVEGTVTSCTPVSLRCLFEMWCTLNVSGLMVIKAIAWGSNRNIS